MTTTEDTTEERGSRAGSAHESDNAVRGRANAWFFVAMDRYINWVAREAKHRAFGGLSGPVICELGPGVGANLGYYPADAHMVGIEPNRRMHPHLHRRTEAQGIDVELHACGAEELPLADESVDDVVCSLVLCTVSDPEAVVSEVRRVLRPGGRFRFVEHIVARPRSLRRGVQRALHRPWEWGFEGCRLDRDTPATLEDAGFADVDYEIGHFRGSVFYPVNRAVWGVATR